ncbi:MAG: hypothetical protein JWN51_2374 [Phycisphaerales bacterium]|nr:hypothetical protein [Phycisphaerales bacterium]
MRRRLFTLLSALSLLLFVGTCGLWVRSYGRCDVLWMERSHRFRLASERGKIEISTASKFSTEDNYWSKIHRERPSPYSANWTFTHFSSEVASRRIISTFDFELHHHEPGLPIGDAGWNISDYQIISSARVPFWFCAIAESLIPSVWLWRVVRDPRARQRGSCRVCGYDLRATPDRCPECGTVPPAKKEISN